MKTRFSALCRFLLACLCCLTILWTAMPANAAGKQLTIRFTVATYQNRARDLLRQVNSYRKQNDLPGLIMSADLESAAIQRAAELSVFFSHERPDLTDYDTVTGSYAALGEALSIAECIAAGQSKAADVFADWQSEADKHLLDAAFTHAGIACVQVEDSAQEYYWVLLLEEMPDTFKGKKADSSATAGKTKTIKANIASGMYSRKDGKLHGGSFELRASDLSLKDRTSANAAVYLYDGKGVKLGKCEPETLSYRSGDTSVFTVDENGAVHRKKNGTATLTISSPGLSSVKCTVTIGKNLASASDGSVTASTIKDYQPELSVKETSKAFTLSVSVKGASGYVIYRSATKNGSYAKVDEKATTSRWDWKLNKADLSKSCYYKVRAYKNAGGRRVYSEYSDPVRLVP